jgi:enoyl-CoA hydratase
MDPVKTELREGIAVVQIDDGKANALSPTVLEGIGAGLDLAEKEAGAVLLVGRSGRFSAGFDLSVLSQGAEAGRDLVSAGGELCARLYELSKPVVAACTGHAIAAGAIVLMAADYRVGARGDFKLGLNETAIGMALPIFALEFAAARLSKRHFERATSQATLYAPEGALDAGYLDAVVEPGAVVDVAFAEAVRLSGLTQPAFALSKRRAHAAVVARIRETLAEDMARLLPG